MGIELEIRFTYTWQLLLIDIAFKAARVKYAQLRIIKYYVFQYDLSNLFKTLSSKRK